MIIILYIGNTQISILLLCFLYVFVELMITMNDFYFLFLMFKKKITRTENGGNTEVKTSPALTVENMRRRSDGCQTVEANHC